MTNRTLLHGHWWSLWNRLGQKWLLFSSSVDPLPRSLEVARGQESEQECRGMSGSNRLIANHEGYTWLLLKVQYTFLLISSGATSSRNECHLAELRVLISEDSNWDDHIVLFRGVFEPVRQNLHLWVICHLVLRKRLNEIHNSGELRAKLRSVSPSRAVSEIHYLRKHITTSITGGAGGETACLWPLSLAGMQVSPQKSQVSNSRRQQQG